MVDQVTRTGHLTSIPAPPAVRVRARARPRWYVELILIAGFYAIYSWVRDTHGRDTEGNHAFATAYRHGQDVHHVEDLFGLGFERGLQHVFLHARWLLRGLGGFYGGGHFVITLGLLMWLLFRRPDVYRYYRSILGLTTAMAVVVFAAFPVLPPRLDRAAHVQDTLATVGGLWSYNRGVLEHIADPYAAMPSLHLGWSTWVGLVLAGTLGAGWSRRRRWLFAFYPLFVAMVVVVTGTHWTLDTFAGTATLCLAWGICAGVRRLWRGRGAQTIPAMSGSVEPAAAGSALR